MIKSLAASLACGVCIVAIATPAQAQTREYRIPAGSLKSALDAYAHQSGRQVIYKVDEVRQARSQGTSGSISAEAALNAILAGSGFRAQGDSSGAVAIVRANMAASESGAAADPSTSSSSAGMQTADAEGVPEILVYGKRDWSLNTGIERTRDDTQPFVVFDQEDIKRSGSTNLEQFLRDYLNANASDITSEQNFGLTSQARGQGVGAIDLRGLGTRETLILVDGRRQPSLNTNEGDFEQPLLTNIPLAAIERIEVLASSAAGIYGAGATGGVINIILRRDYSGRQIILNYADTTDLRAPDRRIDLVVGQSLEGGRTNVSLTASYRHSEPLLNRYRRELVEDPRRAAFQRAPLELDTFGGIFNVPPIGSTPNLRSSNRTNLRLDPIYGGATLSSSRLFVPEGYRGVAIDGVAPLIANIGKFNLGLNDRVGFGSGGRAPIVFGIELLSGSLAVRREMTSWLRVYAEASGSRSTATNIGTVAPAVITLAANAPNNPFQQAITVAAPVAGGEEERVSRNEQLRFLGGAIATLGGGWQAVLDVGYGRNKYQPARQQKGLSQATSTRLSNGTFDVLRTDVTFPLEFVNLRSPDPNYTSTNLTTALKVAGPLPIRLPGGNPSVTLNLERNQEEFSDAITSLDDGIGFYQVTYTPPRKQTLSSAYGEIRFPLIGADNDIPLVRAFEVVVAARYERYKGTGAGAGFQCFRGTSGVTDEQAVLDLCDPSKLTFATDTASNSHIDPTVSAKWTVSPDLALRASYATGYLPPQLNQLIKSPNPAILVIGTDPLRGGEQVGTPTGFGGFATIPGFIGGNPDVRPEVSESLSVGAIVTPRFLPGLRFSADYTKIDKRDNYGNADNLLTTEFATFLELFPERVTRGPASGGFSVGPITSIDASLINVAASGVEAIDFALDYGRPLWGGTIDFAATATRTLSLTTQITELSPEVELVGVLPVTRLGPATFATGNIKWKGNAQVRWSNDVGSIGVRARYFDGYFLSLDRSVEPITGAAKIPSQTYFDIFTSFEPWENLRINAGVNNVFNKRPPFVQTRYSSFGDPRLANFYVNLTTNF